MLQDQDTSTLKRCARCSECKSRSDFNKSAQSLDGLSREGRTCKSAARKKYRIENYEKVRAAEKAYEESHRAEKSAAVSAWAKRNREKHNENGKKWAARNKEKRAAAATRRRHANIETFRAKAAEWRKNNKDKAAQQKQARRARERNAEGVPSKDIVKKLIKLQKCKCAACKVSILDGYHLDHIIPLSRGGGGGDRNLQLLCPSCNLRKSDKDPIDFMRQKGLLL